MSIGKVIKWFTVAFIGSGLVGFGIGKIIRTITIHRINKQSQVRLEMAIKELEKQEANIDAYIHAINEITELLSETNEESLQINAEELIEEIEKEIKEKSL